MSSVICFIIGLIISIIVIKFIFPKPKTIKILPTYDNYNDITYVDESGKLYKYDLIKM